MSIHGFFELYIFITTAHSVEIKGEVYVWS